MSTEANPAGGPSVNKRDRVTDRDTEPTTDRVTDVDRTAPAAGRHEVVRRQREAYGGIKFGSCFFGWLTATGTAVLLTALVAAAGLGVGLAQNMTASDAAENPRPLGLAGAIALVVIVFIAYLAGGYVAGRMARFNGARQGLGVWLWAIVIAIILGVIGLIAGNRYNVLSITNSFPRMPVNEGTMTAGGIILAAALVVVALIGAVLGGLLGMRFHRRVDRVGLEPTETAV
jgi:hypothetical protein